MPVWFENDAPKATIRSLSFMNQLAMGVPLRPSTPQPNGWRSEICPLALNVVATGAAIFSARATTASMSKRAPAPTMISGRRAAAMRSTAAARTSAGGATSRCATRPAGPPAAAPSAAGSTCTSSGSTRWPTARSTTAFLQARVMSSAWLLPACTVWLYVATSANAASRSRSWNAPRPATAEGTCPVTASTGARSTLAS